jgi:DNA-binding MarR family transcriptional regulator
MREQSADPSDSNKEHSAQDEVRDQLEKLLTEVGALAIRLRQNARKVQIAGDSPAGGHNVLRMLHRFGSLTVPQIARLDSTSRQNIQTVVNRLEREGCVESAPNPAHKRSALVRLTDRGIASLELVTRGSDAYKERLLSNLSKDDLTRASELLRSIRQELVAATSASSEPGAEKPPNGTRTKEPYSRDSARTRPPKRVMEKTPSEEDALPVSLL